VDRVLKLSSPATGEFWEIPVIYEDAHLLALNKPSGLLTSPDRFNPAMPSLMGLLHQAIAAGKPWTAQRALAYLMNVHRLDAETSGALLLARAKPVFTVLADLFSSQETVQRFSVLVQGAPKEDRFVIEAKLEPDPVRHEVIRVNPRLGKSARTHFEVAERFAGWTWLRCEPVPCRPHQVRVHLRHAGLPLAGDQLYGGKPLRLSSLKRGYRLKPNHTERPLVGRAALHLEELTLPHPVTGAPLVIQAPWPKDLAVALKYLRRYAMPATDSQPDAPISDATT
jgi:23S rRNA pseudouridine1911/1915/1917 synthase